MNRSFFFFKKRNDDLKKITTIPVLRMPIIDEKAPTVGDFDALLEMLRVADDNTACVFNCQVNMIFYMCNVLKTTIVCLSQAKFLKYLEKRNQATK